MSLSKGFYIDSANWHYARITEIEYEKKTKFYVTGVKTKKAVLGNTYFRCCPSRIPRKDVVATAKEAFTVLIENTKKRISEELDFMAKIEEAERKYLEEESNDRTVS